MAGERRQDPRFKLTRAILERVRKEFDRLEEEYAKQKQQEAENLHNSLAEAIAGHRPSIETLLFVLEMLRFEALQDRYYDLFARPSDKPPASMTIERE